MNSSEILHRALNHSSQGPNVKDITNGNHPKKFVMVEEEKLVFKKYIIHKKWEFEYPSHDWTRVYNYILWKDSPCSWTQYVRSYH